MVSRNRAPSLLLALGLLLVQPAAAALADTTVPLGPYDASGASAVGVDRLQALRTVDALVEFKEPSTGPAGDLFVPLPPTGLTVESTNSTVQLSWDAPPEDPVTSGPVAYRIYRYDLPVAPFLGSLAHAENLAWNGLRAPIAEVPAGTTTYTDSDVDLRTTVYVYAVTAVYEAPKAGPLLQGGAVDPARDVLEELLAPSVGSFSTDARTRSTPLEFIESIPAMAWTLLTNDDCTLLVFQTLLPVPSYVIQWQCLPNGVAVRY